MNRKIYLGAVVPATAMLVGVIATMSVHTQSETHDAGNDLRKAINTGRAKNVILFLGDGMGDSEITVARNYQVGANGRLSMDSLPLTGEYTTYALQESNPSLIDYVTDSAASGTGWATGIEDQQRPNLDRSPAPARAVTRYTTILELAQKRRLQDRQRDHRRTDRRHAGGARLAHQRARLPGTGGHGQLRARRRRRTAARARSPSRRVDHHVNVLLGGGRQRFEQTITGGPHVGKTVVQSAQLQGYDVVLRRREPRCASTASRVLGLFNAGNMSLEWTGLQATPFARQRPPGRTDLRREPASGNEPSLARHDHEGDRAARRQHGHGASGDRGAVLPAGRRRLDRQAGSRRSALPANRRDDRVRSRDQGWARLRPAASRYADHRDRRSRAHQPDRARAVGDRRDAARRAQHAPDQGATNR